MICALIREDIPSKSISRRRLISPCHVKEAQTYICRLSGDTTPRAVCWRKKVEEDASLRIDVKNLVASYCDDRQILCVRAISISMLVKKSFIEPMDSLPFPNLLQKVPLLLVFVPVDI